MIIVAALLFTSWPVFAETRDSVSVDLKLRSGGSLGGVVVAHDARGLVILYDDSPYVFAWDELEFPNAYAVRHQITAHERGGEDGVRAEDYVQQGMFALRHDRYALARRAFDRAIELEGSLAPRLRKILADHSSRRIEEIRPNRARDESADSARGGITAEAEHTSDATQRVVHESPPNIDERATGVDAMIPPLAARHEQAVLEAYHTFGEKVREVLGEDIRLIESEHFLVWTDWSSGERELLVDWCESMYAALCSQFSLDSDKKVFLTKCPVFCFQSKVRFRRFAQYFDGYAGTQAVGYTRSNADTGHVHVVLVRNGNTRIDRDRFACTLVHEGTHAFLHRLYASQPIPHWINEGYAELMAERVLGDRCPTGDKAALLAEQFVRFDWPVRTLLASTGPIAVHEYPLAQSVVASLEQQNPQGFAEFIRDLKRGSTVADALAERFDGRTLTDLERAWRSHVVDAAHDRAPAAVRRIGAESVGTRDSN